MILAFSERESNEEVECDDIDRSKLKELKRVRKIKHMKYIGKCE